MVEKFTKVVERSYESVDVDKKPKSKKLGN